MLLILLIIVLLMTVGAFPRWPHSRSWGYAPSGGLTLVNGSITVTGPGDVNTDGKVDVQDVFALINGLFAGGPQPSDMSDVDGSGVIDVADVFYLVNYLFAGGPAPKP